MISYNFVNSFHVVTILRNMFRLMLNFTYYFLCINSNGLVFADAEVPLKC